MCIRDSYKCIDQGADDTTNAVSIRRFFARVADVATTERTQDATDVYKRQRLHPCPLMPQRLAARRIAGEVLVPARQKPATVSPQRG